MKKTTNTKYQEEFDALCVFIKGVLADKVEKVVVSNRLDSSPCVLVTSKFGWSANMERIMKAQAMGDSRAMEYMKGKRIMEINADSPVMTQLKRKFEANKDDASAKQMAEVCYDTALLTSGFNLDDPMAYAKNVYGLMGGDASASSSSSSSSEPVDPE